MAALAGECILNMPDGARLVRIGTGSERDTVVFCSRDNFLADVGQVSALVEALQLLGFGVLHFQTPIETVYARLDPEMRLARFPILLRRLHLAWLAAPHPDLWRFFWPPTKRRRQATIPYRTTSLVAALRELKPRPRYLIGRSAGARVAALAADALQVRGVICLSYPFRRPRGSDEPERYRHLENIKTPCLIVQGDKDEYGGAEIVDRYRFSPSVKLHFIGARHDFDPHGVARHEAFRAIMHFIAETSGSDERQPVQLSSTG